MTYEIPDIDFYDGGASGQQRKALGLIESPHVMVSYATVNNRPLAYPERYDLDYSLWWDCGASPMTFKSGEMAKTGDYTTSDSAYLDHVEGYVDDPGVNQTLYTLRDYPCETDVLEAHGRTVEDHQAMTIERHNSLLDLHDDRGLGATPVGTLQGWYIEDYLTHLDQFADAGILDRVEYVSIGSVCARRKPKQVANIILSVREALDDRIKLHAFGVKRDLLRYQEVLDAIDSADSNAYDHAESRGWSGRTPNEAYTFREAMRAYLNWRYELAEIAGSERLTTTGVTKQQKLPMTVADGGE